MPRIPYQPVDLAEPRALVEAIRERRGGTLLNLDRMLLHSPPLAQGWNGYLKAVRQELALPPKLRELAMCGVAVLNDALYEFHHHAPEYRKAGGTELEVQALRRLGSAEQDLGVFAPVERAVVDLIIEMTLAVKVSDRCFEAVREVLADERQVVELVGVIATYNMVSRFLVTLGIEPE
jgi:alkylhydroperoxidase family enzyme